MQDHSVIQLCNDEIAKFHQRTPVRFGPIGAGPQEGHGILAVAGHPGISAVRYRVRFAG